MVKGIIPKNLQDCTFPTSVIRDQHSNPRETYTDINPFICDLLQSNPMQNCSVMYYVLLDIMNVLKTSFVEYSRVEEK